MNPDSSRARQIDRRTALTGALVLAGTAGLAACSSASPGSGTSSPGDATTTGHGRSTALARLDSIPVGHCVAAQLRGQPVIVSRPTASSAACFSAICTHMGCTVNPAGTQLQCPCHGSVYSATTGKVLGGPAPRPLPRIPVEVKHGEVVAAG